MRATRAAVAVVAITAAWAGLAGALAPGVYAASSTFTSPAYAGDFPDPALISAGGLYWAYATGSAGKNLQVSSSPDLRNWSPAADPLPDLPAWASPGRTWAPGVIQRNGEFVMYYTVHDTALGRQCLSIATSPVPSGPFVDSSSGPLVCQTADGGSIDPNPYVDPVSGALVLVWKSDDNALGAGHPTHIWGQPLAADGMSLAPGTSPSLLLTMSALWQSPSMEGPTLVRNGSRYYLFYSANNYDSANSGIGYAVSSSLLGSYTNQSVFGPWLRSRGNMQGAQGPWVFRDANGVTQLAFAGWGGVAGYENGGARSMWIGPLTFSRSGDPSIS
jgi:beta-xylosidase